MPTTKTNPEKDSQKISLIPQLIDGVAQLHKLIVTGNLESGEPGLLESIRGIKSDVAEIKSKQNNYIELEKRVKEIEDRHNRIDMQRKRWDSYQIMIWGIVLSNIALIIMAVLGFK